MKIAHVTTVDLSLRYLVYAQLIALRDRGANVIGLSAPGPDVPFIEQAGIRHVALDASTRGISPLADLRAAWQLFRWIRREKPDILHTHNPKPGVYGRVLGRLGGVPIVINTVHGLYATPDDPILKRLLVYSLESIASRFSDIELVQNVEDVDTMRRLRIANPGKTRLLGNGVDLKRFNLERADLRPRQETRHELGIRPDQLLVGIVGRLVAEKGYPELFEAFRRLDERYVLVVVGPDDPDKADALPEEMIRTARDAGVRFLGMRTDIENLYAAMDIFVLPSHREGFPRAAMEAAAMGLPIVATDIRGCRQVVEPMVNGLLIPVKSPDGIAAALRQIGADRDTLQAMGEASRRKANADFNEAMIVERVLEAYRDAAVAKGVVAVSAGLQPSGPEVSIRAATKADAPLIASLHMSGISTGFLPKLGFRFMRLLYESLIESQRSVVLVAVRDHPVGFVAGVADTAAFYREFVRTKAVRAVLAAMPAILRPATIPRAWETVRYGAGPAETVDAELLAMAVDPRFRRGGIAGGLGRQFLEAIAAGGVGQVKVVVGAQNQIAISAYEKMGFVMAGDIQVHSDEPSKVLVWSN